MLYTESNNSGHSQTIERAIKGWGKSLKKEAMLLTPTKILDSGYIEEMNHELTLVSQKNTKLILEIIKLP